MAQKGDAKAISFVEDTAVSPEHLRDYIAEFLAIIARHGTRAGVYAHASVGCLHVRPVINLKTADGVRQFEAIAEDVSDLVLKYGGSLSGEHGDGLVRSPFQEKMYGSVLYQAFRELKAAIDPDNLLNPGKIVDAPPLTANLRYGPSYATPAVATTFDFTCRWRACSRPPNCARASAPAGSSARGRCAHRFRQPATRQHSTRGRANLLRLAISGQLGLEGFTDPRCPRGARPLPRMQGLQERVPDQRGHGPAQGRVPASVLSRAWSTLAEPDLRPRGPAWRASAASWRRCRTGWRRRSGPLAEREASGHRPPPRAPAFARHTLTQRFAAPRSDRVAGQRRVRRVLLFPDTFTNYFEPEIGVGDDRHYSSRAGCAVTLGPPGLRCCGRPLISNGLLDKAVANARHNVECLHEWAQAGGPIIACEPSCILTIKDDYPALLKGKLTFPGRDRRPGMSDFRGVPRIGTPDGAGSPLGFKPGPPRILVQGHCHQRSLVGLEPLLRLLRLIPGSEVVDLEAGCCGMAGSFGYEVEHYDVSRLVGEQRLLPAVRQAGPQDVVVAPGFSCRLQIRHFTGVEAVHPASLLRLAIK